MSRMNLTDMTAVYFVLCLILTSAGIVLHLCGSRAKKAGRALSADRQYRIARICLILAGACFVLFFVSFTGAMSEYARKGN